MSAPLVKYPPAPVSTTASTDSLRSALSRSSAKRENTALLKEFLDYRKHKPREVRVGSGAEAYGTHWKSESETHGKCTKHND